MIDEKRVILVGEEDAGIVRNESPLLLFKRRLLFVVCLLSPPRPRKCRRQKEKRLVGPPIRWMGVLLSLCDLTGVTTIMDLV